MDNSTGNLILPPVSHFSVAFSPISWEKKNQSPAKTFWQHEAIYLAQNLFGLDQTGTGRLLDWQSCLSPLCAWCKQEKVSLGCNFNLQQNILFIAWLTTDNVAAADGLAILLWLKNILISNGYRLQMSDEIRFIDAMFRYRRSETEVLKDFLGATQDVSGTDQRRYVVAGRVPFEPPALTSLGCMC